MRTQTSAPAIMLAIASQPRALLALSRPMADFADSELDVILANPRHPLFDAALNEWRARDEQAGEDIAAHFNRLGGRG